MDHTSTLTSVLLFLTSPLKNKTRNIFYGTKDLLKIKSFTNNDRENPGQKICLIIDLLLKMKSTALHESLSLIVTKDFTFSVFLCKILSSVL